MLVGHRLPVRMILAAICAFVLPSVVLADAKFAKLRGTVQVFQKQKWVNASLSTPLSSGSMIQTGYRSEAVVIYAAGGQIALGPNTKVTILDNPVARGSDRDVMIDHGHLTAFVRKGPELARNHFRMRTPTIVAGVRGSLLAGLLVGKKLTVEAIESAAFVAKQDASVTLKSAEVQLANTRKALATAQDRLKGAQQRITEMQAQVAKLQASSNMRDRMLLPQLTREIAFMNDAARQYQADVSRFTAMEKDWDTKATQARQSFDAIEQEAAALLASLDEAEQTSVPEGGTASASDDSPALLPPDDERNGKRRPATIKTVGTTATEDSFAEANEVKVGIGGDFQTIYTDINTVTQPTSTGLPTLKKF